MPIRGDRAPTAQRQCAGWFAVTIPAQIFDGSPMEGAARLEFGDSLHRGTDWVKTDAPGGSVRPATKVLVLPPFRWGTQRTPVLRIAAEFAVRDVLDRTSAAAASDSVSKSAGFFRDSVAAFESAGGVPIRTTGRIRTRRAGVAIHWPRCSEFQKHFTRALRHYCQRSISKVWVESEMPLGSGGRQRTLGSHGVFLGFHSPKRQVLFDLEALRGDTDGAGQPVLLHGRHGSAKKTGRRS